MEVEIGIYVSQPASFGQTRIGRGSVIILSNSQPWVLTQNDAPPPEEVDIIVYVRTKPNSSNLGFADLLMLLSRNRSSSGSKLHFWPLTEGIGSRAGTRSSIWLLVAKPLRAEVRGVCDVGVAAGSRGAERGISALDTP